MKKLNKCAMFTDIHLGRKNNSEQHNTDCLNYIKWFCAEIKKDKDIDHIIFLGDFFQTRSAIDISTIQYAQMCCELVNKLGLPVYIIIGNHDMYQKHSREVHSPVMFSQFSNFIIIDTPQIRPEIGDDVFFAPYLLREEYKTTPELKNSKVVFGHLAFNNFYVTGYYKVSSENGPEPLEFSAPKVIFSGHFHQRQIGGNIVYIGNTFPFDFSDVDDREKGLCIYDHTAEAYHFINWEECPTFSTIKLSILLKKLEAKETNIFEAQSSINCIVDIPLTYEQHVGVKKIINTSYDLREFNLKELPDVGESLTDTDVDLDLDFDSDKLPALNELVIMMLDKIECDTIDNIKLKEIYKGLTK